MLKLWADYVLLEIYFQQPVDYIFPNICWKNKLFNLMKMSKFLSQVLICQILPTWEICATSQISCVQSPSSSSGKQAVSQLSRFWLSAVFRFPGFKNWLLCYNSFQVFSLSSPYQSKHYQIVLKCCFNRVYPLFKCPV